MTSLGRGNAILAPGLPAKNEVDCMHWAATRNLMRANQNMHDADHGGPHCFAVAVHRVIIDACCYELVRTIS